MASSGSFNTSGYSFPGGTRYLTFKWEITSQSVADNTTTIKWQLIGGGSYPYNPVVSDIHVVIDGDVVYDKPDSYHVNVWPDDVVASGTKTIEHNADGTRTFSASAEAGIYVHAANCSGSETFTLNTIARASQPSCITWPEHTQDVGYFGDTISIHMNRKSDKLTHVVRYAFGDLTGTIANNVTTGTTWVIPPSFMDLLPASTSGSGTIYVDTYNGSTKIGTKYCGFTAKVPASVKPTCTFTLEDITGADDIYGSPVKGLSKIKVTVTAQQAYSSPITSCVITANGMEYSGLTATTGLLKASGKSTVTAKVTDKRGRVGTVSYDMNVQDYAPPDISALTAKRCNQDGTLNKKGNYVKVTFSGSVSSMSNKNTAAYEVKYKKSNEPNYTTVAISALANVYTVSGHTYIFAANISNTYDVIVEVTDRHSTTPGSTKAMSASTIFSWRGFKTANGTEDGAGIGKVAEKPNTLQISWDTEFYGKVSGTIFDAVYPVGSIYLAYNHTNPGTLFPGTTWERIEGAFPWFTGATGQIGLTGGERTVTLTADQIPSHNHGGTYTNAGTSRTHAWLASGGSAMGFETVNTGGGQAHNNMPPYIQISAWRRTA